ncbi:hypothetical protein [Vibrio sp. 1CM8B]|uniref:hypothetical protein n=1 Tax=Vibrio sp. 1CM8B TaxID=2929167 RepID=UPI0020BE729B|nr:hypothetical protein [Vibrio sp. 1CM8B]MCK8085761.1 hypothetical protein [Vibrio sp. 1CM8B]
MSISLNDEFSPEDLDKMKGTQFGRSALLRMYEESVRLMPHYYADYIDDIPQLEWKNCKFMDPNADVPDEKGVYAFSIEFDNGILPNNSYIMYIGKGGELGNKSSILKRYKSYSKYKEEPCDRPKLHTLFNFWVNHITYSYAVTPAGISPGEVEKKLNNIFQPPYSYMDYSVEVKLDRKGANL